MTQLLFVTAVPLPTFYRRRLSRIVPAFVVMLCVVTSWWAISGRQIDWREVVAAAFFVNNYTLHAPTRMPFGHIWSLSVEEHSYILLSLAALLVRRTRLVPDPVIIGGAALCAACGLWYWSRFSGPALDFGLWLHTEVAAYGIFLSGGLLLLLRNRQLPVLPWLLFPIMVGAGIALHWWSIAAPVRTILGVGLFALAINLLRAAPTVIQSVLSMRLLRQLGIWSFSIYLWQQPFYLAAHHNELAPSVALGLAIAAGIFSFYFIEQPMRAYLNGYKGGKLDRSREKQPPVASEPGPALREH
jgi:peptidoglycan/LPS O-acetylase OafA/YrhL